MQDRFAVAADLRKIARLLKIKGENLFKAQAYERAAGALENLEGDFDALVKAGRLQDIPGVGKALAAIIEEIYRTGECYLLEQLRAALPPGAVELSALSGLSLKKIIALNDALHVESIADLKSACQEGLVSKVKGFGLKSQAKLLAEIEKREIPKDNSVPLDHALEEAERILRHLRGSPELIEADIAGALRRRQETLRRIVIVAASDQPRAVLDHFLGFPALARTDELDESHCRGRLANGLQAEIVVVKPDDYAGALLAQTGSRRHVAKIRDLARSQGLSFFPERNTGQPVLIKHESEIYQRLGLPHIPAEMREDEGEIEAAALGKPVAAAHARRYSRHDALPHRLFRRPQQHRRDGLGRRSERHGVFDGHRSFADRVLCARRRPRPLAGAVGRNRPSAGTGENKNFKRHGIGHSRRWFARLSRLLPRTIRHHHR